MNNPALHAERAELDAERDPHPYFAGRREQRAALAALAALRSGIDLFLTVASALGAEQEGRKAADLDTGNTKTTAAQFH